MRGKKAQVTRRRLLGHRYVFVFISFSITNNVLDTVLPHIHYLNEPTRDDDDDDQHGSPHLSSTTTTTNESQRLIGGRSRLSPSRQCNLDHQRVTMTRWWPPQPPCTSTTTTPTTESHRLVGGRSGHSQPLINHHDHQRVTTTRWWSFSTLPAFRH